MMIRQFLFSTIVAIASLSYYPVVFSMHGLDSDEEMKEEDCYESFLEKEIDGLFSIEILSLEKMRAIDRARLIQSESFGNKTDWDEWNRIWDKIISEKRERASECLANRGAGEISIATILAGICLRLKACLDDYSVEQVFPKSSSALQDLCFLHNISCELDLVMKRLLSAPPHEFEYNISSIKKSIDLLKQYADGFNKLKLTESAAESMERINLAIQQVRAHCFPCKL